MFAVSMLPKEIHDPCMRHATLPRRVMRYLKGPHCLFFPAKFGATIEAYCDADWVGCGETGKSTNGLLIKMN